MAVFLLVFAKKTYSNFLDIPEECYRDDFIPSIMDRCFAN